MVNTKMLQEAMRNHGYTIDKLAEKIGRSRTGLFNKIHNKTEFRLSEIDQISRVLKISKADRIRIFFATDVECNSTNA